MFKSFAIAMMLGLGFSLSACQPEQVKEQLEQQLKSKGHIAPTFAELNLDLPTLPNELAGITAKTYASPIKYTSKKSDTTYFYDKHGKRTDKPTTDGYYRHILGVTDDGRTVIQDFYANHAPQVAPTILKQGADESDFDSSVNDSDTIWFDEKGNITQILSHNSGWTTLFKNNQITGHLLKKERENIIVLNYPNSQTVMAYLKITNTTPKEITHIYFYENDNAMFKVVKDDKDNVSELFTWDETGKSVKPKKFAEGKKEKLENMDKIVKETLSSL